MAANPKTTIELEPPRFLAQAPSGKQADPEEAGVSESRWIRLARLGDSEAFGRLVLRHQDAVFRHAWRILRSREDAEDAAQECFLRAWRSLHRFDPDRPFRPWILRIAVNVAFSARSRRHLHAPLAETIDVSGVPDPSKPSPPVAAARRELREALDHAVGALPPDSAALYQLRYEEQLPLSEIARILDRRPGALAVALHRIRERLRKAIFGSDQGETP